MAFSFREVLGVSPKDSSDGDFFAHVRSLYVMPETKTASAVPGVSISFGKRTIVRNNRTPKYVREKELRVLAKEYEKTFTELWNLMKLRKIEVRK